MKKRKGAALPTAVALCTFLLIITFVVTSLIVELSMLNRMTVKENNLETLTNKAFNTFVANNGDISSFDDTTYTWKTYNGENDIKALVAYKNNSDSIVYYSIYDFTNSKVLAYQTSVIYIKEVDGVRLLAGIVPIGE